MTALSPRDGDESPDAVRINLILHHIAQSGVETDWRTVRWSEYGAALDALTQAAADHVKSDRPLRGRIQQALDVIDQVLSATTFYENADQLRLWSHRDDPVGTIKSKRCPRLDRAGIEAAAGTYLALPFRSPKIDRLFVDLLVAVELFAYGNLALNPVTFPGIPNQYSILNMSAGAQWLKGRAWEVGAAAVFGGVFWLLNRLGYYPSGWMTSTYLTIGGLIVLSMLWAIIQLPVYLKAVRESKAVLLKPLSAMVRVYMELKSDGPISGAHIYELVREADAAGAGFPAPLFAVLDDINARNGRF